mgnify:CR=1 FL=1
MRFKENIQLDEAVPKLYSKMVKVTKTIKKMEADRKSLVPDWKSETDSKKKMKIQNQMKKITTNINKLKSELAKLEKEEDETTASGDIPKSKGSAGRIASRDMKNEAKTKSDIDAEKAKLMKQIQPLVAKKKKLYSNPDIESPMTADEKKLNGDIAKIYSQINSLVKQKRNLKESINE